MNARVILFELALISFAGLTLWAGVSGGNPAEVFAWLTDNPWGYQVGLDLVIAVSVGMFWMWNDAKERGLNPVPYMVVCLFLGSIGLLAYAVRRNVGTKRVASIGARQAA